jgi:hypothetical protein
VSYRPVLPLPGYAGWRLLSRTAPQQQAAFRQGAAQARAADHFRANIARATTAEALVADRRLLEVALGAFGLQADLNARAFLRKVLEGGTLDPGALANRLADKRYAAFAREFGYGDLGARTGLPGFADRILARHEAQAFQAAVGERDNAMRLALNLGPALAELGERTGNVDAQWYSVIGSAPLREVFQTAFGLPPAFGALDVDRQVAAYKRRAATLGAAAPADFAEPSRQDRLLRLFFLRGEAGQGSAAAAPVLALLRRGG